MKTYQLQHAYDKTGDPIFRAVTVADEDRRKLSVWYLTHQRGRKHVKAAFGTIRFKWDGPDYKPIADFPVNSDPLDIWSVRATSVLGEFLRKHGDLYPILLETQANRYELFDCWERIDATPNAAFSSFVGGTLKSITVEPKIILPDIFLVSISIGLMVSERFKMAAEKANLTGVEFTEVQVLTKDKTIQ